MPKIVDHDQRRRELVAAAWSVIAAEGIEAATVRRIAEAAGCTTGRVTHYFESKDDVLIAALRRVHTAAGERMARVVDRESGAGRLRSVLLEALPLDDERRLEWRVWLAFWGRASTSPVLLEEQRLRYSEWRAVVRTSMRVLLPGADAPTLSLAADHLVALIDGLGLQAVLEPRRLTPARITVVVDDAIDQLVSG